MNKEQIGRRSPHCNTCICDTCIEWMKKKSKCPQLKAVCMDCNMCEQGSEARNKCQWYQNIGEYILNTRHS